jgi:hypothetical protein
MTPLVSLFAAFAVRSTPTPARELTTRELWSWTHPREVHCPDRFRRKNISRAIRAAAERMCVRVGRRWPHGVLWRLRP